MPSLPGLPRASALAAAAGLAVLAAAAAPALGAGAMGRVLPGHNTLLVTFRDRPALPVARARLAGLGQVEAVAPEAGVYGVRHAGGGAVRSLAARRPRVQRAEWSLMRVKDDLEPKGARPALPAVTVPTPTDPLYADSGDEQWGLKLGALDPSSRGAWNPSLTSYQRPPIAILDGGIDSTHEEWKAVDGQSPLIAPRSTFRDDNGAEDWGRVGHGTHVAGIAAAPINGLGVVGVAPASADSPVMPVQIADRDGRSTDETMIKGIRWAVTHGAKVINISAGGPGYSQAFQNTVNWAYARGALIVASVGNEGEDDNQVNYPAGYDHVLGVGAQCDGNASFPDCPKAYGLARFTNHNATLDVIAPGVNVVSSVPLRVHDREVTPGYAMKDGTSMSAPFVAGVAALVFGSHPGITPEQVTRLIEDTATDIGPRGRDDQSGWGIVNPASAVLAPAGPDDVEEINDTIGSVQGSVRNALEPPSNSAVTAWIDRFDDPVDVYPVRLSAGTTTTVSVTYRRGLIGLWLWAPGTRSTPRSPAKAGTPGLLATAQVPGARRQTIVLRPKRAGVYYVQVRALRGAPGEYRLTVTP